MSVRERLRRLLAERGISQAELERRVGRDGGWMTNRLRNSNPVAIAADDLPAIAEAIGCSISDFYDDRPELPDPDAYARIIAGLLAGCTDAQRAAAITVVQALLTFAREGQTDG